MPRTEGFSLDGLGEATCTECEYPLHGQHIALRVAGGPAGHVIRVCLECWERIRPLYREQLHTGLIRALLRSSSNGHDPIGT